METIHSCLIRVQQLSNNTSDTSQLVLLGKQMEYCWWPSVMGEEGGGLCLMVVMKEKQWLSNFMD